MLDDSLADVQPSDADMQRYHEITSNGETYRISCACQFIGSTCAKTCVSAPPLAPFHPNTEQWRFLLLHARRSVVRWQWHFRDTILRAYADNGDTATISAGDLDELLLAGAMAAGAGCADVTLTMRGMEMCI